MSPHHHIISGAAFQTVLRSGVRDFDQGRAVAGLHDALSTLLKLRTASLEEYVWFLKFGFAALMNVVQAPTELGAMTPELMRQVFGMGEQVCRVLETGINRFHGCERRVGGLREVWEGEYDARKRTRSQKDLRHLRRDIVRMCVGNVQAMGVEDAARRIQEAHDVAMVCAGQGVRCRIKGSGTWDLPRLATPKEIKEAAAAAAAAAGKKRGRGGGRAGKGEGWDAEMHFYAIKALVGAAQCLGHRFCRWPVEIRGQVVPGTGVERGEVLRDWVAVEAGVRDGCVAQ